MFAEGQAVVLRTCPETPMRCHPESSEGSQSFGKLRENQRFFSRQGGIRMTGFGAGVSGPVLGFFDDACPNGVKNLGRNFLKRPEFRGELGNAKFLQEGGEPEQIAG